MLLLTGATGLVGSALLPRLLEREIPVRCLVRDPRRLGVERVRVQIALGDLTDPPSFRNALRGVDTVVHLAAAIRDQPRGSIEELNGIATWRMVSAAERAGVKRFLFCSALGASTHHRSRFFRAKALAEQAVRAADLQSTIFAPSIVYAPGDRWLTLLERLARLPVLPVSGSGQARFQPIWVHDAASCILAELERSARETPAPATDVTRGPAASVVRDTAELERALVLAGPEILSHEQIVQLIQRAAGRSRPHVHIPIPLVSRGLRLLEAATGRRAFATWDEAELMECSMVSEQGDADVQSLGVRPRPMGEVLGA